MKADNVHWFRLADERVVELWAVRDDLTRMQQLGLLSVLEQPKEDDLP